MNSKCRKFRLGTTSFIMPGTALDNIIYLKGRTEDIEILYYETGYSIEKKELDLIKEISSESGMTYTIHLPLDVSPGSRDGSVRQAAISELVRIIDETLYLTPYAYILHLKEEAWAEWPAAAEESLKELLKQTSIEPARLCIENTDYAYELLYDMFGRSGISACLDLGHFISHGWDPFLYFEKNILRCRVVHLYGTDTGHRHLSLSHLDPSVLLWFKNFIKRSKYSGLLTLEVFSEEDLNESLLLLDE